MVELMTMKEHIIKRDKTQNNKKGNGVMPYKTISDLPESVQSHLPKHAQEIYKDAFNNAWEQYSDPSKRWAGSSLEQTASKVAWSAVKHFYEKEESTGQWVKKN